MSKNILSKYETRLIKKETIELPFDNITKETEVFDRCYWAKCGLSIIEDFSKEHMIYLYLASDGSVIGAEVVGIGSDISVSHNLMHCVRTALLLNSNTMVSIHNHPQNNDLQSSDVDKETARKTRLYLDKFKINLLDALVITDNGLYVSTFLEMEREIETKFINKLKFEGKFKTKLPDKKDAILLVFKLILEVILVFGILDILLKLSDSIVNSIDTDTLVSILSMFLAFYILKQVVLSGFSTVCKLIGIATKKEKYSEVMEGKKEINSEDNFDVK